MVNKSLCMLVCWCLMVPCVWAEENIDADTFYRFLQDAAAEHQRHANDLDDKELHLLIEKRKKNEPSNGRPVAQGRSAGEGLPGEKAGVDAGGDPDREAVPVAGAVGGSGWPADVTAEAGSSPGTEKTADVASSDDAPAKKTQKTAATKAHRSSGYRRVPPGWGSAGNSSLQPIELYSDDLKSDAGPLFGIRRGTWIRARLERSTTNVEPGTTEFITDADCLGDYRDLPRGTKIFFNKSVQSGSNRLYFTSTGAVNVITTEGEEFSIACSVADITANKQLGLVGAITTDEKIIQRSMASGAFAAGQSVVGTLGGNLAADAMGAAADSALKEKEGQTSAELREPTFVILVSPQDVYIRVDRSF